jgi:hypothetical protein
MSLGNPVTSIAASNVKAVAGICTAGCTDIQMELIANDFPS